MRLPALKKLRIKECLRLLKAKLEMAALAIHAMVFDCGLIIAGSRRQPWKCPLCRCLFYVMEPNCEPYHRYCPDCGKLIHVDNREPKKLVRL